MIPKADQQCPSVNNFRPISLLDMDYKIFAKIMAKRLKVFLCRYIGEDQTNFLPKHYIKDIRTFFEHIF